MGIPKTYKLLILAFILTILPACSSSPVKSSFEDNPIPNRIYSASLNNTWKASLSALQNYAIREKNREGGVIKTHWIDNTKEINFADAFEKGDILHAARYKLVVNVFSGAYKGQESTRVTIRKKQQVESEMMHGWRNAPEMDDIIERTILYRIGRILVNEKKLEKIFNKKNTSDNKDEGSEEQTSDDQINENGDFSTQENSSGDEPEEY